MGKFFDAMADANERLRAKRRGDYSIIPAAVTFSEFFEALEGIPADLIDKIEPFVPNDSRVVGLDGAEREDFTPITECFQAIKESTMENSKHL